MSILITPTFGCDVCLDIPDILGRRGLEGEIGLFKLLIGDESGDCTPIADLIAMDSAVSVEFFTIEDDAKLDVT